MKIKQTLYIQAVKYTYDETFKVKSNCYKMESNQHSVVIDIDETEVELTCPDFTQDQFNNGHAEQLRKVKEDLKAETHLKLKSLDEQIESLLAIEHKVVGDE